MIRRILDRYHAARAASAEETAARKARVLQHPDLREGLTEPPLSYARPEQWNGWIAPATFNGERNDSPRREALVLLAAEALRREQEQPTA